MERVTDFFQKKIGTSVTRSDDVVPAIGLEPIRCCHRGILSPLRLPIPPRRHVPAITDHFHIIYYEKKMCNSFYKKITGGVYLLLAT